MKKHILGIPDILMHLLLLPLLPLLTIVLLISWTFRQAVRLWLHLSLGDKFGGLMCSADKIYAPADKNRKIILTLHYIRTDKEIDFREKFKSVLEQNIFNSENSYPKLTSTHHYFLGQDYWINNQVTVDDVIKTIPLPDDKELQFNNNYMKAFVGRISNSPLPKNDAAVWDIHVATTPLVDAGVNGCVYPVLIRIHHVVTDGIRLVAFFATIFDTSFDNYNDKLKFSKPQSNGRINDLINIVQRVLYFLYLIFVTMGTFVDKYFKSYEENFIHGPQLSGEKLMAWAIESEVRHVPTVKRIKNKIPNTKFSEVILTCISASISNFFKKHNQRIPKEMNFVIPILLSAPSIDTSKPIKLINEFTVSTLDMPLKDSSHCLEGLEAMKASIDRTRKHPDKIIVYLLAKYMCGPVPSNILKMLHNSRSYAGLISIVPGGSRMKVFGEYDLLSSVSSAPHTHQTGLSITVVTYDEKFHICLFVDKAIISEQEEVQYIADEILRNMDIMDKETSKIWS